MPAETRLSDLATRKRLIVMQADLHRGVLAMERQRWREGVATVREQAQASRWWLIGGAICVGLLLTRGLGRAARWLPAALTIARWARAMRK